MSRSIASGISLDVIKQEIRAEAERRRRTAGTAPLSSASLDFDANDTPPPDFQRQTYAVGELTNAHFRTFVDIAYHALLKRPPDPSGMHGYLGRLARGDGKIMVLGSMRYSPEGRRLGVRVQGLLPRYIYALICKIPVLGFAIELLGMLLTLPKYARHLYQSETYFAARGQIMASTIQRHEEQVTTLRTELEQANARIERITTRTTPLESRIAQLEQWIQQNETFNQATTQGIESLVAQIQQIENVRSPPELVQLRHEVLAMKHWLTTIQSVVTNIEQQETLERNELDTLTADLANRIATAPASERPTREHYLSLLKSAHVATAERPLLDVGCGRGEWLQLLKQHGFVAYGIERNRVLAEQCRGLGLDVSASELQEHLRRIENNTLGALSALQVIEYLPLPRLVAFLDEAKRVLVPGGILLIESFDPGTNDWSYRDPGCTEALAPEPLKHLVESRGYKEVRVLREGTSSTERKAMLTHPYGLVARRP